MEKTQKSVRTIERVSERNTIIGLYSAHHKAGFYYMIAMDRQKYTEDAHEDLNRKYKQLKLRFKKEQPSQVGVDLKSAKVSRPQEKKTRFSGCIGPVQWSARIGSSERKSEHYCQSHCRSFLSRASSSTSRPKPSPNPHRGTFSSPSCSSSFFCSSSPRTAPLARIMS